MEQILKGKRALITGGDSGIGYAVAEVYADAGADLVICARNAEKLANSEQSLLEKGVRVKALQCDVEYPEQCQQVVRKAEEFLGGVDILANVAGISPKKEGGMKLPFWEISDSQWQQVIDVNLNSMFYFEKAVAPGMIRQKYGRIINMSSVVGLTNSEHGPASACYSVSKRGAIGLTKATAFELAPYNITVNAVAGGRITTAMSAANNSYYNELHSKLIPMKRFGTTREVAMAFLYYASPDAGYVTGDVMNITGGWFL